MSATAFANLVGLQPQAIYPATIIAETPPAHPSEIMMYLVAMPRLREVILRPSRVISLHDWNSRRQNREAGLAQTRGNITSEACDHCERGAGPFNQCVTVPDLLNGGCSNCHYMDRAYRCSLTPENVAKTDFQTARTNLEAEKMELEDEKMELQAEKMELQAEKVEFEDGMMEFEDEMMEFEDEKMEFQADKMEFQADKIDFKADKMDFKADKQKVKAVEMEINSQLHEMIEIELCLVAKLNAERAKANEIQEQLSAEKAKVNDLQKANAQLTDQNIQLIQESRQLRKELDPYESHGPVPIPKNADALTLPGPVVAETGLHHYGSGD